MDGAIGAEGAVDHAAEVVGRHQRSGQEDKDEQHQNVEEAGAYARGVVVDNDVLPEKGVTHY